MEVPAPCPACRQRFVWDVDLTVSSEMGWAHPHSPILPFDCPSCRARLEVRFRWRLEPGAAPRELKLAGGASSAPRRPCIVFVDRCPHGCGAKLALQLPPDDPWARSRVCPDEDHVLGGYRCPTCDGEGHLVIAALVASPPS